MIYSSLLTQSYAVKRWLQLLNNLKIEYVDPICFHLQVTTTIYIPEK